MHDVLVSRSQFQIILQTLTTCQFATVRLCVICNVHGTSLDPKSFRQETFSTEQINISFFQFHFSSTSRLNLLTTGNHYLNNTELQVTQPANRRFLAYMIGMFKSEEE